MADITYLEKTYNCRDGETVLEAFLRQGVNLPFSCRAGVCHACLQRVVKGEVPKLAQKGVKTDLVVKNYFLPCLCRPQQDLEFAPPADDDLYFKALVAAKEPLSTDIIRILLEPSLELNYRSGQFLNLRRADGIARSYSLASVPGEDYYLELHVKRMKNGALSNWLIDQLEVGSEIDIQGPNGSDTYQPENLDQNLLLVGTGTGLAPLLGIARTALLAGHRGQIYLYHGSSFRDGLYLIDEMRELACKWPNFHYTPCLSREKQRQDFQYGRAEVTAFSAHQTLAGWQVHLAGNPDMVDSAAVQAMRCGVAPADLFTDAFVLKELRASARPVVDQPAASADGRRDFPPDPEMWAALKEGEVMGAILTDFYTRVFEDPILSPYFMGVTRQRLIEKVYSFMRQIFTGEKRYFGDRPRNTHHWMVIPDDVFDYRQALMETCMRKEGLAEHLIERWSAIEESFRGDIVKLKAYGRLVDGVEQPLVEGFGHTALDVGAICDSCTRVIEAGEEVRYHLRLGLIYCGDCRQG
jgi:ferredoxin-NADP reductase/ferredoxin/truncated hemoglobin YjbI